MDPATTTRTPRPWALHLAVIAAVLGLIVCVQLCRMHLMPEPAGCPSGGGCARVLASHWSAPLGVPLALVGVVLEVLLLQALARAAVAPSDGVRQWIGVLLVAAVLALALSLILMIHLGAVCGFCLAFDALLVAQVKLMWWWLRAQGASDGAAGPTPPILRLVDTIILIPALLFVAIDFQAERMRAAVVASADGMAITQAEVDRLGLGMRQADRALDADIDRALLRRRLDIDLVARQAEEAHRDIVSHLRAGVPDGVRDAAAEQAAIDALHDRAQIQLPQARPLLVQPADWRVAWTDGSAQAPIRLLVVMRIDCGVCASQIRELIWCRAHGLGWGAGQVRIGVIIVNDADSLHLASHHPAPDAPTSAAELSFAIFRSCTAPPTAAAADQAQLSRLAAWRMLQHICTQADPADIPYRLVHAWLHEEGQQQWQNMSSIDVLDAQAAAGERLLGNDKPPRLFLQDKPLGGYLPRERLCGAVAEAQALLGSHAVVDDLDPAPQVPLTAAVVTP